MFTFAWPYIFLLLPLFWIAQKYIPLTTHNEAMLRVPFLTRVKALQQDQSTTVIPQRFKQLLCTMIWLLLLFACANPRWLGAPLPIKQSGHNIILAVDVSPSMEIPDLQRQDRSMNRLETVKVVATDFIEKRPGDKLGLILFASKAYVQTPLTLDRKTVRHMLNDASIGLAGESTAIGDAVGLAIKKLSTENIKSRILILLTDGGNNSGTIDPVQAAELAKDNHIKIYTVGLGAEKMMIPGIFSTQVINPSADLDESLLKKLASVTQGHYFRAQDHTTLRNILDDINQLEPIDTDVSTARPVTALFYWPLSVALALTFIFLFPHFNVKFRS